MPKPNELIEIEVPILPGVDWWFFVELISLALIFFLVIGILFWVRYVFWGSLKTQYLVKKSLVRLKSSDYKHITVEQCLRVNQLFLDAKKHQHLAIKDQEELATSFNQACFGREKVSCETFIPLLEKFLQALKQNQPNFSKLVGLSR